MRDVIVVGAGPGGSATAAYLADAGLDVLLVDKRPFPRDKTCGDAVSPRAMHVLADLALEPSVRSLGHRITSISATGPQGSTIRVALPAVAPFPAEGYVIRRLQLDHLVQQRAAQAGAEFRAPVTVQDLESGDEGVALTAVDHGRRQSLAARFVVLAVGASQPLLRRAGLIPARPRLALAARAYYRGLPPLDPTLHIRFDGVRLPGYGWLFPLPDGAANIGAGLFPGGGGPQITATAMLTRFLDHPPVRAQLRGAKRVGPVQGFPLRTDFHRSPTVGQRTLLVGEAAGLVNPFTGEGIDYALESGQLAAKTLIECFQQGDRWAPRLRQYDRALRRRFQETFVLTHLLRRLYMNPWLLDPLIRAAGRWPQLGHQLVRVFLAYDSPRTALTPSVAFKVLRSLRLPASGQDPIPG